MTVHKKHNRVRTGCFCCRKRKKKCDEMQPHCNGCIRNQIKCIYPLQENEPLPPDFQLLKHEYVNIPLRNSKKRKLKSPPLFEENQSVFNLIIETPANPVLNSVNISQLQSIFDANQSTKQKNVEPCSKTSTRDIHVHTSSQPALTLIQLPTLNHLQLVPELLQDLQENNTIQTSNSQVDPILNTISHDSANVLSMESDTVEDLSTESLQNISEDIETLNTPTTVPNNSLVAFSKYLPNVTLSAQDSELFHNFIHKFIPSITLPHSHPNLSPYKVMVSLASQSPVLTEVYLCCGASYLSFSNDSDGNHYKQLAESKYNSALSLLSKDIQNNAVDMDSDWLFAVGLCLCLRDRALDASANRCAKHLILVYNLLLRRYNQKQTIADSDALSLSITPTERLFVDSFIFNYSAALLSCSNQDLIRLPSPYDLFPKFKQWFVFPIFSDCDVKWMNNPVMGCAINSYEVISKLIWLLRLHSGGFMDDIKEYYINNEVFWESLAPMESIINSIEISNNEDKQLLQTIKITDLAKFEALRSNLAVSIITVNASKVLLQKITNPTIPSFLPLIQEPVNIILHEISNNIPFKNHSACLICLSIFIAGISTINNYQRSIIATRLQETSKELSSELGNNILEALRLAWKREYEDQMNNMGDNGYQPFDLIFDRETIELLTF